MHCKDNYFSAKQDSDIDVELDAGCTDETYLAILENWLPWLFENVSPDLIFYQAGVDILASDRLGKLNLTRAGASTRNKLVYKYVKQSGASLVITMGGG
jgi:acetoin utilization deacetylase AcuC-like enzyme